MRKNRLFKTKEFFRKLHHKKWARRFVHTLLVLGLPGLGAYMHWRATRKFEVTRLRIPIKNLSKTFHHFRIIQMSDIHFGPTNDCQAHLLKVIEKVNRLDADIVVLTGDFLQWDESYIHKLAELLGTIKAKHGIFACLGNHDYGVCHAGLPATDPINHNTLIEVLFQHEVKTLHNESHHFQIDGQTLTLSGVGDLWTEYFVPQNVLSPSDTQTPFNFSESPQPTILLCHNPDAVDHLHDYHYDLMLCGHVHGGQVSWPLIGPLAVPVKNRQLRRGLHQVGEKWIHINRGLGFIFKARLLSAPEISVIELETEEAST